MNGVKIRNIILGLFSFTWRIALFIAVFFMLSRYSGRLYNYGHNIFNTKSVDAAPGRDIVLYFSDEDSNKEIAELLYEENLINNKDAFYVQAYLYGLDVNAGEYVINSSQNVREIISTIQDESVKTGELRDKKIIESKGVDIYTGDILDDKKENMLIGGNEDVQ